MTNFFKKQISDNSLHPMDLKKRLAFEIVKLNYGEEKAQTAQTEFELVFQKRESPSLDATIYETSVCEKNLSDLLLETLLVSSKSEAKRLLEQGSIEIGGQKFTPEENGQKIELTDNMVIRVGKKRFIKIKII